MTAIFVTGTDTGVGKTTVAAALLASARRRGLTTLAMKPVESGCARDDEGELVPADASLLRAAAGGAQPLDEVCPVRLEAPLAPALAARHAGLTVDLEPVIALADTLARRSPDLLLIEGAGGLLVPLTPGVTVADLALAVGHRLLVVARDGLGTINHTLLTLKCASIMHLHAIGVILVADGRGTPSVDVDDNAAAIEEASGVAVLGHLPRLASLELDALADAADRHLGRVLDALLSPRPA